MSQRRWLLLLRIGQRDQAGLAPFLESVTLSADVDGGGVVQQAVEAIWRCSSLRSSGVKTSAGVRDSSRKLPPAAATMGEGESEDIEELASYGSTHFTAAHPSSAIARGKKSNLGPMPRAEKAGFRGPASAFFVFQVVSILRKPPDKTIALCRAAGRQIGKSIRAGEDRRRMDPQILPRRPVTG